MIEIEIIKCFKQKPEDDERHHGHLREQNKRNRNEDLTMHVID